MSVVPRVDVLGSLAVTTATTVGGDTLAVAGAITTVAGSDLAVADLLVGSTIAVGGSYTVFNTVFNGDGQSISPNLPYQNLVVNATGAGQPGFAAGNVTVNDFTLLSTAGQQFYLGGTLTVNGNVLFDGPNSIFDPAGFTMNVTGDLTIQNGARLLDGTSGSMSIGGNLTADGGAQTTGMQFVTVTLAGNFTQGNSTATTSWVDPVTFNGGGIQSVNFTSPGSSQSRFGALTIQKSGGSVLLQSDAFASAVNIVADTLELGGKTLTVAGNFATSGTGVLKMTQPTDALTVNGNATFGGAGELGHMFDGVLAIGGNLTQLNNGTGDEFHPSGTHLTMLTGANPTVTFASPGDVPGTSHFQRVRWTGTGALTLGSDVFAHDLFGTTVGANGTIGGGGTQRRLHVGSLDVNGATFNQVGIDVDEQGAVRPQTFDNVSFTGFPTSTTTLSHFSLTAVGSALANRPIQFNNLTVQTSLGTGGLYAKLVSSNGLGVTLTINGSNDPTGGPSRSDPQFGNIVNGARIVWQ